MLVLPIQLMMLKTMMDDTDTDHPPTCIIHRQLHYCVIYIERANARVPPTPKKGCWFCDAKEHCKQQVSLTVVVSVCSECQQFDGRWGSAIELRQAKQKLASHSPFGFWQARVG